MTLYEYTVQESVLPSGTMTVKLYSELSGLTVPGYQTIDCDFWVNNRVDAGPGRLELENADIRFAEDRSVYAEGFWYKVANGGYAELLFLLDEGSGDTYFWRCTILRDQTRFTEYDLTPGNIQRNGSMKAMTVLGRMQETTVTEFITAFDWQNDCVTAVSLNGDTLFNGY